MGISIHRFALVTACLAAGIAYAGPAEGELFGYRLGGRYPVNANTQGQFFGLGSWVITAQKPTKPAEFSKVELIATPKTFTIANIYAFTEFTVESKARDLESRYADLLQTMYGDRCEPMEKFLEEAFKVLCGKKYELTVQRFKPFKPGDKHSVHVGLTLASQAPEWKAMQTQFKVELEQAEKEGKQFRLDQARKDQALKGLQ